MDTQIDGRICHVLSKQAAGTASEAERAEHPRIEVSSVPQSLNGTPQSIHNLASSNVPESFVPSSATHESGTRLLEEPDTDSLELVVFQVFVLPLEERSV